MSEYEILDLYLAAISDQTAVLGLLISLHFALIVGIFYFLHRSGLVMKLGVLALYSLAYALLLGLLYNQAMILWGARSDFIVLTQAEQRLSGMSYAALTQTQTNWWVNTVTSVALSALWLGSTYFLFFWKRPGDVQT